MDSIASLFTLIFLVSYLAIAFSSYEVRNITAGGGIDFESPQWSVEEQALYWVDNFGQKLYRMNGETGEITTRDVDYGPSTLIVPVRDNPGYVVVAVRSSLYLLKWGAPGGDLGLRQLTTIDRGKPDNYINDGKADAAGRLWFGTFGKLYLSLPTFVIPDQATLYSMDACNFANPVIKKRPVSFSNGITWSLDNKKMYYNDSPTRKVAVFDFDLKTGFIGNQSVLFDFDKCNIPGVPDGITIDKDGNLWVATFNGQRILVIDPKSGELLTQLMLPQVDQVSSVMWGGKNLDILYVTTGTFGVENPKPLSGSMLMITGLGTKGVPENQFVFPDAPNY